MPHQRSPSGPPERPTTPTTPTRGPWVDILNITQQITPRKTSRRCAQLAPTTPTKNTLECICVGLRDGKCWARELYTYWDSIIFPHANDSLGQVVSASQQVEQDELDDTMDVFDDALSASPAPSRRRSPPCTPERESGQERHPPTPLASSRQHRSPAPDAQSSTTRDRSSGGQRKGRRVYRRH
ncbi:hypothetical protein DFH09DRAFT_1115577 [Mycena vulgaris]|nr:hypothetical protein DFH09DRAFT_1115577 [Mycena vulgaris]